jgi:hypothetical protein
MAEQLELLEREDSDYHLDPHTREIGKKGIAEARRVLAEVLRAAAEREGAHAA